MAKVTLEDIERIEQEGTANTVPLRQVIETKAAKRKGKEKPAAGFVRADQIEVEPVDFLVDGIIARDSITGLVGPSGTFKSFVMVDLACCVSTGTPWKGRDVRKGAAFILAGEGRNGLRKRIQGWAEHTGVSIDGAPLYLAQQLPRLDHITTAGILTEVDALAEVVGTPALVAIDTVARALAGDENSSEHMGLLIECADWIRERYRGCVVMLVHHTGHNDKGRARGSSAFYAGLDAELLTKPAKSGDVQLFQSKAKDWEPAAPQQLRPQKVTITVPGADQPTSTLVLVNTEMSAMDDQAAKRAAVTDLKAQGMTIRQISEQTGIPRSTVSRMLNDRTDTEPVWESDSW